MYKNLKHAVIHLEKKGLLKRVPFEVDPYLEMAQMAREAFEQNGPALLFEKVKGSPFKAVANLFGNEERIRFLFQDTLIATKLAIQFKANPLDSLKQGSLKNFIALLKAGYHSLPQKKGNIKQFKECKLQDLPQIVCAKDDGGAFLTLPQVATRPSDSASIFKTNIGMYRIQISGGEYESNQCGLHYQINRDIAKHHQQALERGENLKVSIFLGGPPAHSIAAIMPMPDNLSEILFAGMLSGKRFNYFVHNGYLISSDADFCILGELSKDLKPEGPFADHLGYYSLKHLYPYLNIKKVLYKEKDPIYPFTVVGRPPQEDTLFGKFIHQITKPMVPASIRGVSQIHAVDASGVHPLCLAIGTESYRPYLQDEREPMELLKTANALLGFNQVSLSKYLFIAAKEDNPLLDAFHIEDFFKHMLERVHLDRDLHFQTETTIDTLDYTGESLNHGSKLIIAIAGKPIRALRCNTEDLKNLNLPPAFEDVKIVMAGVLALSYRQNNHSDFQQDLEGLKNCLKNWSFKESYPWLSILDNTTTLGLNQPKTNLKDFLWMTFTRSDPAQDIYGVNDCIKNKHWKTEAPIIIDARHKPQYPKPIGIDSDLINSVKEKFKEIL